MTKETVTNDTLIYSLRRQQSKVNKSSLISQPGAPSIPKNNNTPPVRHQREGCAEGTPLCVPFAKHHLIIVPVFS